MGRVSEDGDLITKESRANLHQPGSPSLVIPRCSIDSSTEPQVWIENIAAYWAESSWADKQKNQSCYTWLAL